jgi:hypothetical protein
MVAICSSVTPCSRAYGSTSSWMCKVGDLHRAADGGDLAHSARSSLLSIFPVGPFGRSVAITTWRGYL